MGGMNGTVKKIRNTFKLTPRGIINSLELRRPIYKQTACFGHFGKKELSWEKLDKVAALKAAAK